MSSYGITKEGEALASCIQRNILMASYDKSLRIPIPCINKDGSLSSEYVGGDGKSFLAFINSVRNNYKANYGLYKGLKEYIEGYSYIKLQTTGYAKNILGTIHRTITEDDNAIHYGIINVNGLSVFNFYSIGRLFGTSSSLSNDSVELQRESLTNLFNDIILWMKYPYTDIDTSGIVDMLYIKGKGGSIITTHGLTFLGDVKKSIDTLIENIKRYNDDKLLKKDVLYDYWAIISSHIVLYLNENFVMTKDGGNMFVATPPSGVDVLHYKGLSIGKCIFGSKPIIYIDMVVFNQFPYTDGFLGDMVVRVPQEVDVEPIDVELTNPFGFIQKLKISLPMIRFPNIPFDKIKEFFSNIGKWIFDNLIKPSIEFFSRLFRLMGQGIEWVRKTLNMIIDTYVTPLISGILKAVSFVIKSIFNAVSIVISKFITQTARAVAWASAIVNPLVFSFYNFQKLIAQISNITSAILVIVKNVADYAIEKSRIVEFITFISKKIMAIMDIVSTFLLRDCKESVPNTMTIPTDSVSEDTSDDSLVVPKMISNPIEIQDGDTAEDIASKTTAKEIVNTLPPTEHQEINDEDSDYLLNKNVQDSIYGNFADGIISQFDTVKDVVISDTGAIVDELLSVAHSITLSIGHNASAQGATNLLYKDNPYRTEYRYNSYLAEKMHQKLIDLGHTSNIVTRQLSKNEFSLRNKAIEDIGGDFVAELHCNGLQGKVALGTLGLIIDKGGSEFAIAKSMVDSMSSTFSLKNRGVLKLNKGDRGYSLSEKLSMPSVIVESFFITTNSEFLKMSTEENIDKLSDVLNTSILDNLESDGAKL